MTSSGVIPVVVGVDIGGTNTDAVLVCHGDGGQKVLAEVKELTTSDVNIGVKKAVLRCLLQAKENGHVVAPVQVNIGTTHFVNAVVQGKDLAKVAVVRICGPVSEEILPFSDFPSKLARTINGSIYLVRGGFRYDGKPHEPMDEEQLRQIIREVKGKGISNIAYIGIFSPTRPDQENRAREITKEEFPEATVSLSHEIGHIGLLERENATILNECLKPLCKKTVGGFQSALEDIGVTCRFFLTQNDGSVISSEGVLEQPVLTFASGPTNSMRGATFLSDVKDAIVVDIGGTTTDVGVLKNGFPREAAMHVKVGGVRTNFRIPDVISIGLGGGSYVREVKDGEGKLKKVTVGPLSAGYNLVNEAYVYSDGTDLAQRSLTASDIAVAYGLSTTIGSAERVKDLDKDLVNKAVDEIHLMVEALIDRIKLSNENLPVIVVGGGSILMDMTRVLKGSTKLIVPEHFGVANAIGAAMSKVSASINTVVNLLDMVDAKEMEQRVQEAVAAVTNDPDGKEADRITNETKKPYFIKARDEAIDNICSKVETQIVEQGGDKKTIEILDKQDSVISYMPGNATQIKLKLVADLARWESEKEKTTPWSPPSNSEAHLQQKSHAQKQTVSVTGVKLDKSEEEVDDKDFTRCPQEPKIDPVTGEWILNEWDVECLVVGAGIYGCGGGASIHMGRLRALKTIKDGKSIRIISPDRLLKHADPDKDMIIVNAFIGAPLIMYEQGVSSSETTKAMECLRDVYEIGGFRDADLTNKEGVTIETTAAGANFVQNYQPTGSRTSGFKVIACMSAEIGGMNAIEPLLIAANLGLPVVDADGMSRAFPEVQMFMPFMYGNPPYPITIVGSGNYTERSALLYCPGNKLMENFLRDVSIENGCSAGMAIPMKKADVMTRSALHTVTSAWRLGDAILRARINKQSVVEAIMQLENAKHIITGKIRDVQRETSGGFNRGYMAIEGVEDWLGKEIRIDFQNENLVIIPIENGKPGQCIGSVPDLICVVEADTAEPVQVEDIKYGMRVAVVLMPSHDLLRTEKALQWVGPKAFHYPDITFKPFRTRTVAKKLLPS